GPSSMHCIVISSSKVHQTKYGAFPHSEMIGQQFGSKIFSKNKKGYVYLLHPTSELWTMNLPHRTQILYSTDISMAVMQLGIKPGSVVIETGTGSASMSHALIRTVAPTGHLYTFEFHKDRCEQARKEFKDHKVDHLVTINHRDVLKEGFQLDSIADAVFLDLPCPWDAISTSKQAIKISGGRICSFSPCIEQVQKTCETMTEHGFKVMDNISTAGSSKSYDIKPITMQIPEFLPTSTTEVHCTCIYSMDSRTKTIIDDISQDKNTIEDYKVHNKSEKSSTEESNPEKNEGRSVGKDETKSSYILKLNKRTIMTAKSVKEMPGHTGFLTFATLFPKSEIVN
ncbi:hypothetical protein QZH41_011448, partial [Actinostola sp. cb2023]